MPNYRLPSIYKMSDLPSYQRLLAANPGEKIGAHEVVPMYSKAIDWFAIIGTIWPDFTSTDYHRIEVGYILGSDPEEDKYPEELYRQIAETIAMFWKIQLADLYPNGDWRVEIWDDPEVTIEAEIRKTRK